MFEFTHYTLSLLFGEGGEVHALGDVQADPSVGVPVLPPLPGGAGMGVGFQPAGDAVMGGEFLAVIVGDRPHTVLEREESTYHGLGPAPFHVGDERGHGTAFIERHPRLTMSLADERIHLPVADAPLAATTAGRTSIETVPLSWPRREGAP